VGGARRDTGEALEISDRVPNEHGSVLNPGYARFP
jgi:hypothetical protein